MLPKVFRIEKMFLKNTHNSATLRTKMITLVYKSLSFFTIVWLFHSCEYREHKILSYYLIQTFL